VGGGALPPGRRHPPDLVLVQQAPQGGGRGAKLAVYPRQGPRVGDQPVYQIGPHVLEAQLGGAAGETLLGGMLALAGELLAAWWLVEVVGGDGAAQGRLVVAKVGGPAGDAPAQPSSSRVHPAVGPADSGTCSHVIA
jgi:hypothetical protein